MGLKDHLEDVTGRIPSLGLDLDYLHVEGTDWQACLGTRAGSEHEKALQLSELAADAGTQGNSSVNSSSSSSCSIVSSLNLSSSSYSNCSEESTASDSDEEQDQYAPGSESQDHPPHHQDLSSARGSGSRGQAHRQPPIESSPPAATDPLAEYRAKVDFALKLGYSEELVLLVLKKLGPDALINDMLGELVKLGAKSEPELQAAGSTAVYQSPFSSSLSSPSLSSAASSLDPYRLLCPSLLLEDKENLRPVVVDGSNVAMSHGNKEVFSCQGIQLAVDWFLERGHRDITVFVPAWRKEQSRPDALIADQEILRRLEKEKILVFTPSRRVQGRRVVCYDDRFIVKLAHESDGIIVSNDNYRDLANEKPEWKRFIDERLLMYSFVNDKFMPPDDPLGRHGPSLENFLRKRPVLPEHRKQPCPYGKKCTYGHKCKFYHPERGSLPQRSVADELRASAKSSSASKRPPGDAVTGSSRGLPNSRPEGPKKQPAAGAHSFSIGDLLEERPGVRPRVESRRGSGSSSSSSYSGSGLPGPAALGGPPPSGSQDRRDHPGSSGAPGAFGAGQNGTYPACVPPELRYGSALKAYSSLSLVVPQGFFPDELRAGSLPSDCSSEGSASSDSFSPDPLFEDGPKCHHHHHRCSSLQLYPQPAGHRSPGVSQHAGHGYVLPQAPRGLGDPLPVQPSPHRFKPSLPPPRPRLQHASPHGHSGCPGEPSQQTSTPRPHPHAQSTTLGWDLAGSPWLPGSPPYEGSPLRPGRDYPSLGHAQHSLTSWDHCYRQPPQPCYEPLGFQGPPEGRGNAWPSPWERCRLSPRGPSGAQPPPAHQPPGPQRLAPPALGRYQELRDKAFVNLCHVFPPDSVRVVMGRYPHMMDAQQLAAAILSEKSQR